MEPECNSVAMEHDAPECNSVAMEHDGLESDSEITAAPIKSSAASPCTSCVPKISEIWQAVRERNEDLVRSIIQAATFDLQEVYCPGTFCRLYSPACYNNYVAEIARNAGHVWTTLATFMPLLHLVVTRGELGIISYRTVMGAKLNARDSRGQAALECAMECQRQAAIDLLAAYEAIENASSGKIPGNGYTLHLGRRIRSMEMVKLILQHGTGPTWKSSHGWTALHIAASNCHDNPELVTRLVDCGAPIDQIDNYDECSALHYAIESITQPQTVESSLQYINIYFSKRSNLIICSLPSIRRWRCFCNGRQTRVRPGTTANSR